MSSTAPYAVIQPATVGGGLLPFAKAYFTLSGTTTTVSVYSNDDRTTPHTNPVVADENGIFPQVYLDPSVQYRMRIIAADGDLSNPLVDVDPANQLQAALSSGDVTTALGYTPVNPANAQLTAQGRMTITSLDVLPSDALGFRVRPTKAFSVGRTLELDDAGKTILKDDTGSYSLLIPTNAAVAFPLGTVIYLQSVNTGTYTIARDTGVELRIAGSATNADAALAQWGYAELVKYDTDKWMIRGTGVS